MLIRFRQILVVLFFFALTGVFSSWAQEAKPGIEVVPQTSSAIIPRLRANATSATGYADSYSLTASPSAHNPGVLYFKHTITGTDLTIDMFPLEVFTLSSSCSQFGIFPQPVVTESTISDLKAQAAARGEEPPFSSITVIWAPPPTEIRLSHAGFKKKTTCTITAQKDGKSVATYSVVMDPTPKTNVGGKGVTVGDPIDITSGNVYIEQPDIFVP